MLDSLLSAFLHQRQRPHSVRSTIRRNCHIKHVTGQNINNFRRCEVVGIVRNCQDLLLSVYSHLLHLILIKFLVKASLDNISNFALVSTTHMFQHIGQIKLGIYKRVHRDSGHLVHGNGCVRCYGGSKTVVAQCICNAIGRSDIDIVMDIDRSRGRVDRNVDNTLNRTKDTFHLWNFRGATNSLDVKLRSTHPITLHQRRRR
mmetsp:Transcript_14738/g.25163  ORF Transcript_14738/g.25163 Transcript_14738/m.25163 type:complete len:202 (-) Transcript_14738:1429-2034(-)